MAKPKQLLRDILDFNAFNNALRNSIQLEGPAYGGYGYGGGYGGYGGYTGYSGYGF